MTSFLFFPFFFFFSSSLLFHNMASDVQALPTSPSKRPFMEADVDADMSDVSDLSSPPPEPRPEEPGLVEISEQAPKRQKMTPQEKDDRVASKDVKMKEKEELRIRKEEEKRQREEDKRQKEEERRQKEEEKKARDARREEEKRVREEQKRKKTDELEEKRRQKEEQKREEEEEKQKKERVWISCRLVMSTLQSRLLTIYWNSLNSGSTPSFRFRSRQNRSHWRAGTRIQRPGRRARRVMVRL